MEKPCPLQNDNVVSFTKCKMKHFFVKLQKEEDEVFCKNHSLSLEFYCTICKEIICMDCFILLHKQHETKTIKYARGQALDLVDTIKSIRDENASGYGQIHQRVLQKQKNLEDSKRDIIEQTEKIEKKIHGLISSVFQKTKLYYESFFGETNEFLQGKLKLCEKSIKLKGLSPKLSEIGDLQLACMLEELALAKEEGEKETVNIEEVVQTLRYTNDAPIMAADEQAIFDSVMGLFKHIKLNPSEDDRSLLNEFTFGSYMNGEYLDDVVQKEMNDAPNSPNKEKIGMLP